MKLLVTAGPTREYIDPVRFITNRSSGKMGYALAEAAVKRGFETVLVTGPVNLAPPEGARVVPVESAAEMAEAVKREAPDCDAVVMAAAVADYRPAQISEHKLKKQPGGMVLELERTEDILASLGAMKKPGQLLVGFAAETDDLLENAAAKLRRKNLDWIAANKVCDGFGADTDKVTLLGRAGQVVELPLAPKPEVARRLLDVIFG
jgi:phosphopantothenoylcysteine decarboxylase/phosphopantothenate--cysteine ligase